MAKNQLPRQVELPTMAVRQHLLQVMHPMPGPTGLAPVGPCRGKPQAQRVGIRFRGARLQRSKSPGATDLRNPPRWQQLFRPPKAHLKDGAIVRVLGPRRPHRNKDRQKAENLGTGLQHSRVLAGTAQLGSTRHAIIALPPERRAICSPCSSTQGRGIGA